MAESDLITAMFGSRANFLQACQTARRVRTPEGSALLLGEHVLRITPPKGITADNDLIDWLVDSINRFGARAVR